MAKLLARRRHSDRGDSSLVTFVLVMPLFFMFLMTLIDTSVYFVNRATVQHVARDGARQVALLAGDGTATTRTRLEESHGRQGSCALVPDAAHRTANQTEVECQVLERYADERLLTVTIDRVDCGPSFVVALGQETYCSVTWSNAGVPGSALNFIRTKDGASPYANNVTLVTTKAEASTEGISPVPR